MPRSTLRHYAIQTSAILLGLSAASSTLLAAEADFATTRARLEMAMEGPTRTPAEIARDFTERKPVATLEFFRFRHDMKVLELIPGAGWYTKLLGPTVRGSGKLYVAINTDTVEQQLLNQPGFDEVSVLHLPDGMNLRNLSNFQFDVKDLDLVLTFRNLHNLSAENRAVLNKAVYDSLKSGGLYGIKDHTRRHMETETRENGRRLDPVLVIKELLDAGFEFVDYSNLHASAVDGLTLEVGDDAVTGQTDRFTLLFRKP
jgi:predicted methyltransferase